MTTIKDLLNDLLIDYRDEFYNIIDMKKDYKEFEEEELREDLINNLLNAR